MEILEAGNYYHIYNRGNNKEILFREHEDYVNFLNLYLKYLDPIAELYCYCLIPNHFHFLLRIKEINEIYSTDVKTKPYFRHFSNYFNAYSKYINHKYNRVGSLFQERYRRKKIDSEIYLKYLIHYIHTNPVHHDIIDSFDKYPYSSYKVPLKNKPSILKKEKLLELFEDKENYTYTHKRKARTVFIERLIKGD